MTILSEIEPARCTAHDFLRIRLLFGLDDATGEPGGELDVPFTIRSDRPSQGFCYSIDFDEETLEALPTEKLFERPSGNPYEFEVFDWNNANDTPLRVPIMGPVSALILAGGLALVATRSLRRRRFS